MIKSINRQIKIATQLMATADPLANASYSDVIYESKCQIRVPVGT